MLDAPLGYSPKYDATATAAVADRTNVIGPQRTGLNLLDVTHGMYQTHLFCLVKNAQSLLL
jgi:hypothetical protein